MRAYELPVVLTPDGKLELPEKLRKLLPREGTARMIVLVPDPDDASENQAWAQLTADQFSAGYAAADAVYDRP
jgi:hypothetical protein